MKKHKTFHKRQKTHINFNHIQGLKINTEESNSQKTTEISSVDHNSSSNTIVDDGDIFNMTLQDLNSNKTMRKVNLKQEETIKSNSNPYNNIPNQNKNQKPMYLFYRTPSNKDNKKFDFVAENAVDANK